VGKRFYILGIILIAAAFVFLARFILAPGTPDPIYQGKPLSKWVATPNPGSYDASGYASAIVAVKEMGTNALPYLIHELRSQDSPLWGFVPPSAYRLKLVQRIRLMSGPNASLRQQRAVYFLEILGPAAKPAIPALSECLDRPDIAEQAAEVLGYYGMSGHVALGREATLPLLKALTNGDARARFVAANALGLLGTRPDLVVPALINALKDPAPDVRAVAARSFGSYKSEADVIVPALMLSLDDKDPTVRQGTLWMLGMYRARALNSVPKVLVLLNDPDFKVRQAATNALKYIDTNAPAGAGIK
jgi:HEAT repeats/HEAT repeat